MSRPRTSTPQRQETPDQRLARAFEAMVAEAARLITNSRDTDDITEFVATLVARHRRLDLDPARVQALVVATGRCFGDVLARR